MDFFFGRKPTTEQDLSRHNLPDDEIVELLVQCFLVEHGGRPAYLFQTVDIEDYDNKSIPVLMRFIKERFPTLHTHKDSQGLYVSRTPLRPRDVDTNAKAGKVLGYLCADDYDRLDRSKTTYSFHVSARLKNKMTLYLYSFVCASAKHKARFEKDVMRVRKLLVGNKELPLFHGKPIRVASVEGTVETGLPVLHSLTMLLRPGKPVPPGELSNILFNLGFTDAKTKLILSAYNAKSATHRGIMAALLCLYIHNPLEPFYPLQLTGKHELVDTQLDRLAALLARSLRAAA